MDDIRAIVSPDRLTAIGMGVFDSTGYREDGTPYERPGRTTVALSRRPVGEDWVADHTPYVAVSRCADPLLRQLHTLNWPRGTPYNPHQLPRI